MSAEFLKEFLKETFLCTMGGPTGAGPGGGEGPARRLPKQVRSPKRGATKKPRRRATTARAQWERDKARPTWRAGAEARRERERQRQWDLEESTIRRRAQEALGGERARLRQASRARLGYVRKIQRRVDVSMQANEGAAQRAMESLSAAFARGRTPALAQGRSRRIGPSGYPRSPIRLGSDGRRPVWERLSKPKRKGRALPTLPDAAGAGGRAAGGGDGGKGERDRVIAWLRVELRRRGVTDGQLFSTMDDDRSDSIGVNEFDRGLGMVGLKLSLAESRRVFRAIDKDGGGTVTWQELSKVLEMPKQVGPEV